MSNSDGENPLDYATLASSSAQFIVVATNALTGEAKYFEKSNISKDDYDVFKASCAIPFVCRPYEIGGVPYYDGALSDPIPIKKAFEEGCDRVVLILTKPRATIRTSQKDMRLAKFIRKKYPQAARGLECRAERYNQGIELAKQYEKEGKLLIVAPEDTCGVDTLTRDKTAMQNLYIGLRLLFENLRIIFETDSGFLVWQRRKDFSDSFSHGASSHPAKL